MKIITVARPKGDPLIDTVNIQNAIDELYNERKQGRIQLSSGRYKIGYFEKTTRINGNIVKENVPVESYVWNDGSTYRFIGLLLKSVAPEEVENVRPYLPFIEIVGSGRFFPTILEKFEMPEMVPVDPQILDYLNAHYRAITKMKPKNLDSSALPAALRGDLDRINTTEEGGAMLRKVIKHILLNAQLDHVFLIRKLLDDFANFQEWDGIRSSFRTRRLISTHDVNGGEYGTYDHPEDSLYIKLRNLHVDGINDREKQKGWYSNGLQFGQSHLLSVYARGEADHKGKIRVICDRCTFKNSVGDGILAIRNTKLVLNNVKGDSCARQAFGATGTNMEFRATNVECTGRPDHLSVFGFEIDNAVGNPEATITLNNIESHYIKLTLGNARASLNASNLKTSHGLSQSGYTSRVRIFNSQFQTMPYSMLGGKPHAFYHPGHADYYNCEFSIAEERKLPHIRENKIPALLNVTMQFPNFYRQLNGGMFAVLSDDNDDPYRETGEKLAEFIRENQRLSFHNCRFLNASKIMIENAVQTVRDYLENNNDVAFNDCGFNGSFRTVFSQHSGRLSVSDTTANLTAFRENRMDKRSRFILIRDDQNTGGYIEMPFGLELNISGEVELTNSHYYLFASTFSERTTIQHQMAEVSSADSRLLLANRTIDFTAEITGKRIISGRNPYLSNPNAFKLDGFKGDEFWYTAFNASDEPEVQKWVCTQTGDNEFNRPSVWQRKIRRLREKAGINFSSFPKIEENGKK